VPWLFELLCKAKNAEAGANHQDNGNSVSRMFGHFLGYPYRSVILANKNFNYKFMYSVSVSITLLASTRLDGATFPFPLLALGLRLATPTVQSQRGGLHRH